MSESSFYECCDNFGTHTAACTRAALARMRRRNTPLVRHDPRDSDFGRCDECQWDAFERVTEGGLQVPDLKRYGCTVFARDRAFTIVEHPGILNK
jgi:hypothetical protein